MTGLGAQPEVLDTFAMAKTMLNHARPLMTVGRDRHAMAIGVLLLHDAVELALAAIAQHLDASFNDRNSMIEYFGLIEQATGGKPLRFKAQCRTLNRVRNSIKHAGILPDPRSAIPHLKTAEGLLSYLSVEYFGLELPAVSLAVLIENEKIRNLLAGAQREFESSDFKACLERLSYVSYELVESGLASHFVDLAFGSPGASNIATPKWYESDVTLKLLERGVDPYLYSRFKNLTPQVSKFRDSGQTTFRWNKDYGHPGNWTKENASFCLDFAFDMAYKFQREGYQGYTLKPYWELYVDIVTPVGDQAVFYDASKTMKPPFAVPGMPPTTERIVAWVLSKGQALAATTHENKDDPNELMVFTQDLFPGLMFVDRNSVEVRPLERQGQSFSNPLSWPPEDNE